MSIDYVTQRGQALALQFAWKTGSVEGPALDLTGVDVTVRESNRDVLLDNAVVTVTDAENGISTLSLNEAEAMLLGAGRTNWFRLEAQWPDDSNRVTTKIWINVQ